MTRVCQTIVRLPRWTATHSAVAVEPAGAGARKLVFDLMAVVVCPALRFSTVAQPPSVSASAISTPPCRDGRNGTELFSYVHRAEELNAEERRERQRILLNKDKAIRTP